MSESKKKSSKAVVVDKTEWSLPHLLLDQSSDKYRLVPLAVRWAYEVRQRDQNPLPPQELVNQALREILTGKVSLEEIEKLPPVPKVETKSGPLDRPERSEAREPEEKEKGKKSKD